MCTIFEFSDFAKKMWKKIRFKFENPEKVYKGFPRKKNPMGILCKLNLYQNLKGFLLLKYCRRSVLLIIREFIIKMNANQILKEFPYKIYVGGPTNL